jgi:hypothetical protein
MPAEWERTTYLTRMEGHGWHFVLCTGTVDVRWLSGAVDLAGRGSSALFGPLVAAASYVAHWRVSIIGDTPALAMATSLTVRLVGRPHLRHSPAAYAAVSTHNRPPNSTPSLPQGGRGTAIGPASLVRTPKQVVPHSTALTPLLLFFSHPRLTPGIGASPAQSLPLPPALNSRIWYSPSTCLSLQTALLYHALVN